MNKLSILFLFFVLLSCSNHDKLVYKDKNAQVEKRVEDLIGRMTIEEKVAQTIGAY